MVNKCECQGVHIYKEEAEKSELKCIFVGEVGEYVSISTYYCLDADSWIGIRQRWTILTHSSW